MAKVTFKEEHNGDGLIASVDLVKPLQFASDGTSTIDLADGTHHIFWTAFGPPAATVMMSITAPAEAKFVQTNPIGPQMKNSWAHEFHVGTAAVTVETAPSAFSVPKSMAKFIAPKSTKKKGKNK